MPAMPAFNVEALRPVSARWAMTPCSSMTPRNTAPDKCGCRWRRRYAARHGRARAGAHARREPRSGALFLAGTPCRVDQMSLRVLSAADVEAHLDSPACADAMEAVLAALRAVTCTTRCASSCARPRRPADGPDAGLPRCRAPALRAQGDLHLPREPWARARPAPGRRAALRRRDGRAARARQRLGHHGHPHRGRVGGRDARAGAPRRLGARDHRRGRAGPRPPGRARGRAAARARAHRQPQPRARPRVRRRGRGQAPVRGRGAPLGGRGDARRATSWSRPRPRASRSSGGRPRAGHAPQPGRLQHPDHPRDRERRPGPRARLRRPARIDRQRVRRLPHGAARRRDRRGPHQRRAGRRADRQRAGAYFRRRITAFISLGLAVEDLAAAELVLSRAEAAGAGTVAPW